MIIKDRQLTDKEVNYNIDRLKNMNLRDIMHSNNLIDLYYKLGLYIATDKNYNDWSIRNDNINVDTTFLDNHYNSIRDLENKAYIFTIKKLIKSNKLNKFERISETKKEVKDQFNQYYRKYFNFIIVRYQKSLNITNDAMYFLTNDYMKIV